MVRFVSLWTRIRDRKDLNSCTLFPCALHRSILALISPDGGSRDVTWFPILVNQSSTTLCWECWFKNNGPPSDDRGRPRVNRDEQGRKRRVDFDFSLDLRVLQKWFTYQNLQNLIRKITSVLSKRSAQGLSLQNHKTKSFIKRHNHLTGIIFLDYSSCSVYHQLYAPSLLALRVVHHHFRQALSVWLLLLVKRLAASTCQA